MVSNSHGSTLLYELGAGVELEGSPVKGLLEDGVGGGGMEKGEFGIAECCGGVFALEEFAVEGIHQLRGGGVAHFPERANDVVRAGTQERPGKADEALAGIGARTR